MKAFIANKIYNPILSLLKQGLSPEMLSWSLAGGAVLGLFPIIGLSSTMCFGFALFFRLNQVAIQVANYAVYPVQLILIIPYIRLGEQLFGYESLELSPEILIDTFSSDLSLGLSTYGERAGLGVLAWIISSVPLLLCMRYLFLFFLRKVKVS